MRVLLPSHTQNPVGRPEQRQEHGRRMRQGEGGVCVGDSVSKIFPQSPVAAPGEPVAPPPPRPQATARAMPKATGRRFHRGEEQNAARADEPWRCRGEQHRQTYAAGPALPCPETLQREQQTETEEPEREALSPQTSRPSRLHL